MRVTVNKILGIAKGWVGYSETNGGQKKLVKKYNAHKPLARGYKMKYTDEWCAMFISDIFIEADAVDMLGGTEVGADKFIDIFKRKGIWHEKIDHYEPMPGDIILYNWDDATQPNDGHADHIGIIEHVYSKDIVAIEGNMSNGKVGRRRMPKHWGYIRGFARPKYKTTKFYPQCSSKEKSLVNALNDNNIDSSIGYRRHIAKANGITMYFGTAKQNIRLLNLMKKGVLKRPE